MASHPERPSTSALIGMTVVAAIVIFSVAFTALFFEDYTRPASDSGMTELPHAVGIRGALELNDCARLNQPLLMDTCYFEYAMTLEDKAKEEFLCFGKPAEEPECKALDPQLACRLIKNPYLAYTCFRVFMRPHMKEFATKGEMAAGASVPDIGAICDTYKHYQKLFCLYLHAASLARSDLAAAGRICSSFSDELLMGECEYYVSTSLVMMLGEDMSGVVATLMEFCGNVSYPPWKSECYFVLADELVLLPDSSDEDIALACRRSSETHDYWCTHHVAYEMAPEGARRFCDAVDDDYKPHCYLAYGEVLTLHFMDNVSRVMRGCSSVPSELRNYCFEGIGRRISESFEEPITWRIRYCDASPEEFKGNCMDILGEKVGYFAANVSEGLEECALFAPGPRETCLSQLSQRVGEKLLYDIPSSIGECDSFPLERRGQCISHLSLAIGRRYYHDLPAGIEKCGQFPAEFREECIQVLSQTIGERLSPNRELGMKRCNALQPELRESCVQGLLCGFESCDLDVQ